ncbi:MAG TPA: biotin/lipoyl-containing protein [Thermoanaerobaculia bacterium]
MELIARHGDRTEKVRVRQHGNGYEVVVGDRVYQVDAANGETGGVRSLLSLLINGAQHEVSVRRDGLDGGEWTVSGRHGVAAVSITDPLTHLAAQTRGGKGGKRHKKVTAYMPGRVVAVLVEEGGTVTAGQGVIVLEAMKMENEIRAETDGTIARIFVQPGQAVDMGNPLFELD